MKKLFLFLFLLCPVIHAGDITSMVISPNGATYSVNAWGIKDLGEASKFEVKVADPAFAKIAALIQDQAGGKDFIRAIVLFAPDGSILNINVQSVVSKKFEPIVKSVDEIDGKSKTDIEDIKSDLQAK